MNERIRELAEQAMESTGVEGLGGSYMELNPEKFAKLIIKKCAMIGNYAYDGGEYPGKMIKEYFGVE
jgi:hypothetical protein